MGLFVLTWLFAFWLSLNPAVASLVETKHINWWPRSYSVNCDEGIHCQLSLENEGGRCRGQYLTNLISLYTTKSYSEAICDCKFVKNVVIRAVPRCRSCKVNSQFSSFPTKIYNLQGRLRRIRHEFGRHEAKNSSTEKSYVVDSITRPRYICEEIHRVRDVPALAYCNVSGACSKETVIDFQNLASREKRRIVVGDISLLTVRGDHESVSITADEDSGCVGAMRGEYCPKYVRETYYGVWGEEKGLELCDFRDIDVSDDGIHWFHLLGWYCCGDYPRLKLLVR